MKKFIAGLLIALLVCSTFIVNAGDTKITGEKTLFGLMVNGKMVKMDRPIISVNGEYYISAKKISEAMSLKYAINSKAKRLEIGQLPAVQNQLKSTFNSAARINTVQTLDYKDAVDHYKVEVKVMEVKRGEDAWQFIWAASTMNKKAPIGYEYLLARISFKLLDMTSGKEFELYPQRFSLFTSDGKKSEMTFITPPEPALKGNLYPGASVEGWAVFLVPPTDRTPKLGFGNNYNSTEGIWLEAFN